MMFKWNEFELALQIRAMRISDPRKRKLIQNFITMDEYESCVYIHHQEMNGNSLLC
jgi:hypothetical protein